MFGKCKIWKCNLVLLVCFVLYIDVLSVSVIFSIRFCIYVPCFKHSFEPFFEHVVSGNDGDAKPVLYFKVAPTAL